MEQNMAASAEYYRKLSDDELVRRWKRLEADTSAYTMEAECQRMYGLQEIGTVLTERNLWDRTR